jgi:putative flippase GtrA
VIDWRSTAEWRRIFRYYQAGILNTLFGYGLYSAFVAAGLNMYVAQIISTIIGAMFNFITYSRYLFPMPASKLRFFATYAVNYVLSAGVLYAVSFAVASPYLAGLATVVIVSVTNYLILRRFVFKGHPS